MSTATPQTIRARIDPAAIGRVNAFFDATPGQTLAELYQNARRAGARRIEVTTDDRTGTLTVSDDGAGIADPASVLAFGQSEWSGRAADEQPAGMGLYALARYGGTIASSTGEQAWQAALAPRHFTGEAEAAVSRLDPQETGRGTAIRIEMGGTHAHALYTAAVSEAAYLPVPVRVNGQEARRWDFLTHAMAVVEHDDVRIGVIGQHAYQRTTPTINFHGLQVRAAMPHVGTCRGALTALIDVKHCPELELVLPARERAVETPFLEGLRERVKHAIYATIAQMQIAVPHQVQEAADAAGVKIADPPARLEPAWPTTPQTRMARDGRTEPVDAKSALIVPDDWPPSHVNAITRAARRRDERLQLWHENQMLEGYRWYDELPRATALRTRYRTNGRQHVASRQRPIEPPGLIANEITLEIQVETKGQATRRIEMPTDVALGRTTYEQAYGELVGLVLTRKKGLDADTVAEYATQALLTVSDAHDAPSPEDQTEAFYNGVLKNATRLLESDEEALRVTIARAVERHVAGHCPAKGRVRIRVRHQKAEILGLHNDERAPAAADE